MISITIKYGLRSEFSTEVEDGTTVRQIVQNPNIRAVLRYPENVSAVIDGQTVSLDDRLSDGDIIVLEQQAAAKA
jgi:hypothetical protein